MVCFRPEGDRALSPQHYPRPLERRPWLSPSKNAELAGLGPQQCLSPNLNAGRLHLLRKGLTPEARWSQLGMYSSTGSLVHKAAEMNGVGNGSCPSPGRVTAPCTPLRSRPPPSSLRSPGSRTPLVAPAPGGQSSVVTFRFIEKASVRTLNGLPLAESGGAGGALTCGASGQGSCCPAPPKQHQVAPTPDPTSADTSEEPASRTGGSGPATPSPAGRPAPLALSGQGREPLSHKLKLETSASDPLLTGSKFLASTPSSLSLAPGSPHPLTGHCLSSSLTNGMGCAPRDLSALRRSPQSVDCQVLRGKSRSPSSWGRDLPCLFPATLTDPAASSLSLPPQGSPWAGSRETSAHAQRIAKAKWEFFYGSLDPPWAGKGLRSYSDNRPVRRSQQPSTVIFIPLINEIFS